MQERSKASWWTDVSSRPLLRAVPAAFALLLAHRSLATVEAVAPLLATGLLLAGVPVRELWFRRLEGETSGPAS